MPQRQMPQTPGLQVRYQVYSYIADVYRPLTLAQELERGECRFWCHDERAPECRVYWGSHGCDLVRGHDGEHLCNCGGRPYYGPDTNF